MENLCRICTGRTGSSEPVSIFGTTLSIEHSSEEGPFDVVLEQTVAQAMGSCLDVEVKPNDQLPQHICGQCLVKLRESWTLRETCKASERRLRQMLLAGSQVKEESRQDEDDLDLMDGDFLLDSTDDAILEDLDEQPPDESPKGKVNPDDPLHSEHGWSFSDLPPGKFGTKRGEDKSWEIVELKEFRCCGCFKFFPTKSELGEHCKRDHKEQQTGVDKKRFECDSCLKLFASTEALAFHQKLARLRQLFHCKFCGVLSPSKRQFRAHLKLHAKDTLPTVKPNKAPEFPPGSMRSEVKSFVTFDYIAFDGFCCCDCWFYAGTKREMKRHGEKEHFGNRGFEEEHKCFACWRSFESKDVLDRHMADLNAKHVYFCKVCDLMFRSSDQLQIHQQTSANHEGFIELEVVDIKEEVELDDSIDSTPDSQALLEPPPERKRKYSETEGDDMPAAEESSGSDDADYDPDEGGSQRVDSFLEPHGRRLYAPPKTKQNDADLAAVSIVEVSSQDAVRCCGCYQTFLTDEELVDHCRQQHHESVGVQDSKEFPYECDRCFRRFNKATALQMHTEFVKTVQSYACKLCNEKFSFQTPFLLHYDEHERQTRQQKRKGPKPKQREARFYCCFTACKESYEEYGDLLCHVDEQHGVKRNQFKDYRDSDDNCCELCFRSFNNYRALIRHILHQTKAETYQHTCSTCGLQLRTLGLLKDHENKHLGIKPYVCEICNKTFGTKTVLNNHMTVHKTERPFSCEICGKTFSRKRNWKDHSRIHQDLKPWECEICKLTFRIETQFMTHMRRHTGVRPYKCGFCEKVFSHATDRKRHEMAAHTGEKPHGCSYCTLAFVRKRQLVIHERTHTGEKPFECPYCSQAFIQQGYLTRHLATHKQQ